MQKNDGFQTVDEYIADFSDNVQAALQQVRETIRAAAPEADEVISYGMPTFRQHGNLVHFGAFKKHIGFYPTPSGIVQFADELSVYKGAKGSVQFPLDEPMPLELIRRITQFRVEENVAKAAAKKRTTRVMPKGKAVRQKEPSTAAWPKGVAKPAQRALAAAGYRSIEQLTSTTEAELLELHGMGAKALGALRNALQAQGLSFAKE